MSLIRLPGLIDAHVHLREPGATQKEDFYTGSRAALRGGFTYICDMPNIPVPTFSPEALQEKISLSQKAVCDIGFHYGTKGENVASFKTIWNNPMIFGLKLYCNHTTGDYLIDNPELLGLVFVAWDSPKPILVHAEGEKLALVIELARRFKRNLHVCHISLPEEIDLVRRAKKQGQKISAGVTPHHLFLTRNERKKQNPFQVMKPPLVSKQNQALLWQALYEGTINLIESDHAPHTKAEKESINPPFGVPGLETTLPLLLNIAHTKKMTIDQIKRWLYDAPKQVFKIPDQPDTYIEVDPEIEQVIGETGYESKCGWSPFHGWKVHGKVMTVVFKGKRVVYNGKLIKQN